MWKTIKNFFLCRGCTAKEEDSLNKNQSANWDEVLENAGITSNGNSEVMTALTVTSSDELSRNSEKTNYECAPSVNNDTPHSDNWKNEVRHKGRVGVSKS
jgi:hypothetical protein